MGTATYPARMFEAKAKAMVLVKAAFAALAKIG
jgi:hypothetical protein